MKYLWLPAMLLPFVLVCSCRDQGRSNRSAAGAVAISEDVNRVSAKVRIVKYETSVPIAIREHIKHLHSDRAIDRAYAAMSLAELGKEAETAIPVLMSMLNDEEQLQWQSTAGWRGEVTTPGREAAIAVGKISRSNAHDLLEMLDENRRSFLSGEDPQRWAERKVRVRNSIVGLGYTRDQRAVTKLLSLLDDEPELVAVALGQIGDTRAVPALIEELRKINRDVKAEKPLAWSIQREVVFGLSHFQDSRTFDVLVEAIKVSGGGPTAKMAAQALGKLGDQRAASPKESPHPKP